MPHSGSWLRYLPVGACLLASSATGQEAAFSTSPNEAIVESIVLREEAASGREFDAAFRARVKGLLAALPRADILALTGDNGLGNALGDSQADLVYTPITPCRIIDTRLAGGALAAGTTRSFLATGADYSTQGGSATGCGVPFGPTTAVMVNFVAVDPTGQGNLQVTPFGSALPIASIINYRAAVNLANGLAVAICNPSVATCSSDITIKANVSATNLAADVQGYFQRVTSGGVLTLASGRTMRGNWSAGGFPATAADQNVWTAFTFPLTLASGPAAPPANYIALGGSPTTSCPGTSSNPQAAAGQLCVYVTNCSNAVINDICAGSLGTCGTADPYGALIYWTTGGAGQVYCYGTWAVTAP